MSEHYHKHVHFVEIEKITSDMSVFKLEQD